MSGEAVRTAIRVLVDGADLAPEVLRAALSEVMAGAATPAQIGALLMGLRMKGETVAEMVAAAEVLRALSVPVEVADRRHLIDTCGTGGDGAATFNISTASALVAACAGAHVAKHGNRSVSSRCGSADVLEAAGVTLSLSPARVARCIEDVGVGFLFAPHHHDAMRHASGPRRELGVRTLFNLLGPLTNPARAPRQLVGVFSETLLEPFAQALQALGSEHVLVVHSTDGLDEISPAAPTWVAELRGGTVTRYQLAPADFGLPVGTLAALRVADVTEGLALLKAVLAGAAGPASTAVALNAGAAIYVAGVADDFAAGVRTAQTILAAGRGLAKLAELVACTGAPDG
ncbi:MAG: anthranilate phosphoribosyltransferase [Acidiferrobacter sp.]